MAGANSPSAIIAPDSLRPSELGSKAYWDQIYARELENHEEDVEDEGTIWFSESNAEKVVLKQLGELESCGHISRRSTNHLPASRFLDLGTGNGHMLFEMLDDESDEGCGWDGEMVGVDYSEASVQLARRIAAQRDDHSSINSLHFEHWDLLSQQPGSWLGDGFDVVLDKGTFDAISLMRQTDRPCELYRHKVVTLLKPGSFLIITSCNWTRDELISRLAPPATEMSFYADAKYPTFTFGGKTGQSVVTSVFRKNVVP